MLSDEDGINIDKMVGLFLVLVVEVLSVGRFWCVIVGNWMWELLE